MSLVLSLVASSSRPTLAAAVRPARRFKADKVAKPKAGTKRAGGPPVDAGDSTTETLKRVRISRLSATRECLGFEGGGASGGGEGRSSDPLDQSFLTPSLLPRIFHAPIPQTDQASAVTFALLQELYHPDRPSYKSQAPWQPHRPDALSLLASVLPTDKASAIHQTIAHAQLVHQSSLDESRSVALKSKHRSLFAASEELRVLYPEWYDLASNGGPGETAEPIKNVLRPVQSASAGRVEGMFPVEMRTPTDSQGRDGWDYDWTAEDGASDKKAAA